MELWIRSQDKKSLVNTKTIEVCNNDIVVWDEEKYDIKIYLGKYKTQERALEVLDEIQSKIAQNQSLISLMNNFTDLKGNEEVVSKLFKDIIYEMPKE